MKKENKLVLADYTCPRCNFKTRNKEDMRRHLYKREKPCSGVISNIELTDEIKQYILANRIYQEPKISKTAKVAKEKSEIIKLDQHAYYHYIYLVRPDDSVLSKHNVYKIGKTILKQKTVNLSRLTSYRQGSELIIVCQCINANLMENEIIKKFREEFKSAYGNEYFVGSKYKMINIISDILDKEEKDEICEDERTLKEEIETHNEENIIETYTENLI